MTFKKRNLMFPAKNIAVTSEFKDAIFFRASCSCADPNHDHTLVVSIDEDFGQVQVEIYQQLTFKYPPAVWDRLGPLQKAWLRLKIGLEFILAGQAKLESQFLLDEKSAIDY